MSLVLGKEQLDLFEQFESELYRVNQVMNLTRVPHEECVDRHFLDSLLLAEFLPTGATVLDIGTGPGFPAWPLACARPDLRMLALDSSGKMLGFLRSQPLSNLAVVQERIEDWDEAEIADVVTGRALAPLPIQLEISARACNVGGQIVPMRSASENPADALNAISKLGLELKETHLRTLPGTDIERQFPIFTKAKPTPKAYPRRWAEIKRKPL
ncbi:MAG: 16S rRNA (guanine(527)-N(7))-methyltransferase RsmG [Armatimonadetes bacterium]|nr:16S rRNA (guanine(527)-N(7))-methyltransferase RsmG [Armatimonadota bacterium]